MQDTAPTQQPQQAPANPVAGSLAALEASLKKVKGVELVTPDENEAKVKAALKEAKALLKALRKEEDTPVEQPVVDPTENRAKATNANITPDQQRQIDLATEQFKQSVQRVDNQLLNMYVQAVQNGDYAEAEDILRNAKNSQQTHTLMFALLTIGAILLPLYARQRLQALYVHFGLHAVFANTDSGQKAIKRQAELGAESHVQTIAKDLKNSLDDAIDTELTNPDIEAAVKEKFPDLSDAERKEYLKEVRDNQAIYQYAREQILSGSTRDNVIKNLQENFASVSKRRANVIAGNEANRVFNASQFEADEQFLAQNQLTEKAYKRLVSNTGHPEALCKAIIEATHAKPIPFTQDFIPFGKNYTFTDERGKVKKFKADFEHLKSGTIHVNCHCRYELLIKKEDGTFLNTFDGKNAVDFTPELHPRTPDGKFTKKASGVKADLSKISKVSEFNDFIEKSYFDGSLGHHSQEVTDSVRAYQGHYYDAINLHARANTLEDPLNVYGEKTTYGDTIGNINIAGNVSLDTDMTLYRGTEISHHLTMNVGESINSRSFLSTSVDKRMANKFKYKDGSTLVISVKKGHKVILPDYVTFGKRGRTMGEGEVLIPTNSKLTITKIDGSTVYADLS